jgi:hypothetical protein
MNKYLDQLVNYFIPSREEFTTARGNSGAFPKDGNSTLDANRIYF